MNTMMRKVIAFMLCFVLFAGCLPANVWATEGDAEGTTASEATEVTTEPTQAASEETEGPSESTETTDPSTEATEPEVIAVTGITLDVTTLEVGVGAEPVTLSATILPENATDKNVTWTSSEPGVASVVDGVLTFGYKGEAVITATAGVFSTTCTVTVGEGEWTDYADGSVVVIAGSDYQQKGTAPQSTTTSILNQIKKDYATADGFLFGGDYYQDTLDTTTKSKEGKEELDAAVTAAYPNLENRFYIQGNHDADSLVSDGTLTSTGAHDTENYGVYAINEKDYPWGWQASSSFQSTCKNTADALDAYLDAKADAGYTRPIFVITHVPLHYTPRTSSMGDGKYAKYLYDVLDEAGEKGLNIIFLFGHNHSNTYDDYVGGGQIYLAKGKTIAVANEGSTSSYFTDTLNFTYMNCGYVGYIGGQAGTNLSMSVFEITGDEVIVKRYGTNGLVDLKAAGKTTSGAPTADTSVVASGATISLGAPIPPVTLTDNNVAVTAPGLTGLSATKAQNPSYDKDVYSAFVSYDINPEGYEQGKSATVTITLDEADGFDASRKVVVLYNGTKLTETDIVNGTVTFKTTHFSTYDVAQVAETAVEDGAFVLDTSGTIDTTAEYLIVSTGTDGEGTALTVSNGESIGTTVTISGGQISLDNANAVWKFTDTTAQNEATGYYIYPSSTSGEDPLIRAVTCQLNISGETNGEYTIQRDSSYSGYYVSSGSDWTYSRNEATVYLFKRGGGSDDSGSGDSGSGDSGNTGGSTVVPVAKGWVTISDGIGKIIYKLDVDGVDAGSKYLIVSDDEAIAMSAVATSNNGAAIEFNDDESEVYTQTTAYEWVFDANGNSYVIYNAAGEYLGRSSGSTIANEEDTWSVSGNDEGSYNIANGGYKLRYSGSSTAFQLSNGSYYSYPVRLYKYDSSTVAGTAEYAKMEGDLTYLVARGTNAEDALAKVKEGITVLVSANADGSDPTTLLNTNTDITWEWDATYSGTTAGEYGVTIKYKGIELGTVKVQVPAYDILGVTVEPASATVDYGVPQNTDTGAKLNIDVKEETGDDTIQDITDIPVTLAMLRHPDGSRVTTSSSATFTDLRVVYNGVIVYEGFTLTVSPKEGNNYPNYPDPGAVKVNKTATGIDFQASGVATVELSASGIPMNEGVDVVLVLDTSSSMDENSPTFTFTDEEGNTVTGTRIDLLRPVVNNLIQQFKTKREDGNDPDIDIAIVVFNGNTIEGNNYIGSKGSTSSTYGIKTGDGTVVGGWEHIKDIDSDWADDATNHTPSSSGTNYDYGLQMAYELLAWKKANSIGERKQFVLFLSDGAPSQYNGVESNDGQAEYENWLFANYKTTSEMPSTISDKNKGFYFGYNNNNGQLHRAAEAIKALPGDPATIIRYDEDATGKLEDVNGLGATMYSIGLLLQENGERSAADQEKVLRTIASDESRFRSVENVLDLNDVFNKFAQEVLLAATNARFEDQMGEMYDLQLTPVDYLPTGETENYSTINPVIEVRSYEIYTRAEYEAGEFTNVDLIGTRKTNEDGSYKYTTLETVEFQYTKNGNNDYTLTGATSDQLESESILSKGVVCGKYFYYNTTAAAVTVDGITVGAETFYWKLGDIKTAELSIRYNVYLTGSLDGDREAGSYDTNKSAILYYDNYLGNPCKKEATSPTMAWEGAIVRYAFYLVDASSGKPVNNEGVEVPFAQRVVIVNPTDYANINLFDSDAIESREVVADHVLPAGYWLYDESASYAITVSGNGTGEWTITSDAYLNNPNSTYVTGFDGDRYTNELKVVDGTYDYTHTTVWFAVQWEPRTVADTVVIDYGLPVDVHVLTNDMFGKYGKLIGVANGDITSTASKAENAITTTTIYGEFGTVVVNVPATGYTKENSVIRYTLSKDKGMQMTKPEVFTYSVQYTNPVEGKNDGFYYGTLTIIPATTIYYEDTFLDLTGYTRTDSSAAWTEAALWTQVTDNTATQDEDRPGDINFAFDTVIDANNVYGNDSAYETMAEHSLGNAASVHVDANSYATATFTFYGTGFDVISMTSNTTGTLAVQVSPGSTFDATNLVRNTLVDTFYGMEQDGSYSANDPAAIYQVPVIKISKLEYGQYTVKITATYNKLMDHTTADGYDLYLDAIRIYDPTGNENEIANGAYAEDGEAYPVYEELRNNIISAEGVTTTTDDEGNVTVTFPTEDTFQKGAIFIDCNDAVNSIKDYVSYGPNNELYLANGQAIAFTVDVTETMADVQLGIKVANGGSVTYEINGDSYTVNTTTDMYYSIWEYVKDGEPVTIENVSGGILSLTNIKATFSAETSTNGLLRMSAEDAGAALMMLRRAPVVEEPTEPETTEPSELDPSEPDPSEPETQPTEPETQPTEPETEPTEPETQPTEPETPAEPEEPEAFEPDKLSVYLSTKSVKVGKSVLVTVTTSADVQALTVNGIAISRYTYSRWTGTKTWIATVSADAVGNMDIAVVAYNAAGVATEPVINTVTVTETSGSFLDKLFGWLLG